MNLFVVYIGGCHPNSLIELHDLRFIVANSIEDTYDALRKSWWGIPKSLHIDAWGILKYADGHSIQISQKQSEDSGNKLFFVNLGGYDKKQFTELHKNIFVVAANEFEAKQKALIQISDWESPHRDYLYEVDNLLNINSLIKNEGYYLSLNRQAEPKPFEFTCCYNPIGRD
ncbi:DUF1543 domain-containing protein [Legionella qingyii]|uniref:DUF1543 domain-containing protein n=1 Tax=Legionella qingyii TaxID=2184757 RepID=A0A317U419_9GAMM|nr:DUF1543 domain-containing protein [Legionella qingyii]PWY55577.1 DUF1543 domain-containing protein [Legionella qingyii]RUR21828.1 DUF1543 domain-containing protein [Legionella qingyii]RUR25244.1 DUF1543 domain-containing protein [Legionella qingyii]